MRALFILLPLMLLIGCGYRPAAHHAQEVVMDSVSTQVQISMRDPENSVIIKDAVNRAVLERFRASLVEKGKAKTHLLVMVDNIKFSPLQYNQEGYIVTYRTHLSMQVLRSSADEAKTYRSRGLYDFAIEPNAIISDQARYEAIRIGAQKAIDSFIAQVSAEGAMRETK